LQYGLEAGSTTTPSASDVLSASVESGLDNLGADDAIRIVLSIAGLTVIPCEPPAAEIGREHCAPFDFHII
jgi:hypothetical protein